MLQKTGAIFLALLLATFSQVSMAVEADDVVCTECVDATDIAPGAVLQNRIADGAVSTSKIRDGAVTRRKFADGAVNTDKLQNSAVTSVKIANGAVIGGKLSINAVTTDKLAPGAVNASKIQNLAVTAGKLQNDAVVTTKIADGAVTSAKLDTGVTNSISTNTSDITALQASVAALTVTVSDLQDAVAALGGGTGFSAAMLNGTYSVVNQEDGLYAGTGSDYLEKYIWSSEGTFTFDGVGTVNGTLNYDDAELYFDLSGNAEIRRETGTDVLPSIPYSVASTGIVTLTITEPGCTVSAKGPMLSGGSVVVLRYVETCFSPTEDFATRGILVLMKR